MIGKDKIIHFVIGYTLTFGLSFFFHQFFAFWMGSVAGFGKEFYDSGEGGSGFDNYDLFATAGGSLCGALTSVALGITPRFL